MLLLMLLLMLLFPFFIQTPQFEYRNSYFYELGDEAVPTHNELLRECASKGLLSFELPTLEATAEK